MGNPVPCLLYEALWTKAQLPESDHFPFLRCVKFPNVVGHQHVVIGCHWHFALAAKKYRLQEPIPVGLEAVFDEIRPPVSRVSEGVCTKTLTFWNS